MKYNFIKSDNSDTLILFFAGWGFSPNFLEPMANEHCSVLTLYDYRDISDGDTAQIRAILNGCSDITLIAWSFGVFYADYLFDKIFTAETVLPTKSLAINGTLFPVDDEYGVPENIFQGTLDGLDTKNLQKFYLRIAGSRDVKERYFDRAEMDIDTLKDELAAIHERAIFPDSECSESRCRWTDVYLSREDKIFPYDNLLRFWSEIYNLTPINLVSENGPHFPFYKWKSWEDLVRKASANVGVTDKNGLNND